MKTKFALAALLAVSSLAARAESPLALEVNAGRGELEIRFKEHKLLVYAFSTNQFKPYVRELYTLRGDNVLRDAPADHLHHHGLMYAIRINGTNFWEETGPAGIEKSVKILSHKTGQSADGLPQAQFTQLIHWLSFTNRFATDSATAAVLIERRTLTLTVDEKNGEVALRWHAEFEVGKNAGAVTLHGSHYNGLGLRLPKSFDKVAKFQNSEEAPYPGAGTRNLIPAKWSSVTGQIEGRELTVALFGHPANAHNTGPFFSLLEPFAYMSVTQNLEKEPLQYSAGDKFQLRYQLAVYAENKSRQFIQQRYERWEKGQK